MNSAQSYFFISLLLITALIAIICLLILATDQPDAVLEGQRRHVVLSQPQIPTTPGHSPQSVEWADQWQEDQSTAESTPFPALPLEFSLEKLTEFGPSGGAKFMSLSLVLDQQLRELLFLAKDDGRIEVRALAAAASNGTPPHQLPLIRSIQLPTRIYRLRPVNASAAVSLDASFSRLQFWDLDNGQLKAERQLQQPCKDIAIQGHIVFALGRFEGRIEMFDLSASMRSIGDPIRLGEHCQSLAHTDSDFSLLLACPSGIVEISLPGGQILRTFNQSAVVDPISAIQVLAQDGGGGSVVLAASRICRQMLLFDSTGGLKAKLREKKEEKGLWLWTVMAMLGDRLYALEYIRNRVEVFRVAAQ